MWIAGTTYQADGHTARFLKGKWHFADDVVAYSVGAAAAFACGGVCHSGGEWRQSTGKRMVGVRAR